MYDRFLDLNQDHRSVTTQAISSGITTWRSTGATALVPFYLAYLATAYAKIGHSMMPGVALAKRRQRSKQPRKGGARLNRMVGEIELNSRRRKGILIARFQLRVSSRLNHGSCALR